MTGNTGGRDQFGRDQSGRDEREICSHHVDQWSLFMAGVEAEEGEEEDDSIDMVCTGVVTGRW